MLRIWVRVFCVLLLGLGEAQAAVRVLARVAPGVKVGPAATSGVHVSNRLPALSLTPTLNSFRAPLLADSPASVPGLAHLSAPSVLPVQRALASQPLAASLTGKAAGVEASAISPAQAVPQEVPARRSLERVSIKPAMLGRHYDGFAGRSAGSAQALPVYATNGKLRAGNRLKAVVPNENESSPDYSDLPSPKKKRSPKRFKTGLVLGLLATAAVPLFWQTTAPLNVLHAGFLALLVIALALVPVSGVRAIRGAYRQVRGETPSNRGHVVGGVAGFLLAVALMGAPLLFPHVVAEAELSAITQGTNAWKAAHPDGNGSVDKILEVMGETRNARAFSGIESTVINVLSENPEGRQLLDDLRDRGGALRLPSFFIAELGGHAGARYISPFDGIFIGESALPSGVTLEQLQKDPAKLEAFVRTKRSTIFHELFHAAQFRRTLFVPGQFENFPHQVHKILVLETEYETYAAEVRYVHAELAADPARQDLASWEIADYTSYLNDFDKYFKRIDNSPTYKKWFWHIDSEYYRGVMEQRRGEWAQMSVDGYLLLARRADAAGRTWEGRRFRVKAEARAKEYGLKLPSTV